MADEGTAADSPLDGIWERMLGWIPGWVGFLFAAGASVAVLVAGIVNGSAGLIAFGVWGIASTAIAYFSGAVAEPKIDPFKKSFGAVVQRISTVPWLIIAGLFVVAVVTTLAA